MIMEASPGCEVAAVTVPQGKGAVLPAISESVPVYEGNFRLLQDVVVSASRTFMGSVTESHDSYPQRNTLIPGMRQQEMLFAAEDGCLVECARNTAGRREISGCDSA